MLRIVATELLTYWFVRAECSTADEPGQVARIGGLSNFGKVSKKERFQTKILLSQPATVNAMQVTTREKRTRLY